MSVKANNVGMAWKYGCDRLYYCIKWEGLVFGITHILCLFLLNRWLGTLLFNSEYIIWCVGHFHCKLTKCLPLLVWSLKKKMIISAYSWWFIYGSICLPRIRIMVCDGFDSAKVFRPKQHQTFAKHIYLNYICYMVSEYLSTSGLDTARWKQRVETWEGFPLLLFSPSGKKFLHSVFSWGQARSVIALGCHTLKTLHLAIKLC